jgi:hypothetical protein
MSPETNQEEFRLDLILNIIAVLNDSIIRSTSYNGNTSEHSGKLTNGKVVMEFLGSGQKLLLDLSPDFDGSLNQKFFHGNDISIILLWIEESFKNLTIDIDDSLLRWRSHVQREEVSLQSVGDRSLTTGRLSHSS